MFSVAWHSQNKLLMLCIGALVFFATHSIFIYLGFFFSSRLSEEGKKKSNGLPERINRLRSWLAIPFYILHTLLQWQARQALNHKSVKDFIPHIVNPMTKDPGAAAITACLSSTLLSNIMQNPNADWSGIQALVNGNSQTRCLSLIALIAHSIPVDIFPSIQRFKPLAIQIIRTYAQLNAYRIERSVLEGALKSAFTTTT